MTGYVLSPAAQRDIDQIWDYTAERWGLVQADRYILAIRDACQELADKRRLSRAVDDIRPGYRQASVGAHLLFFRAVAGSRLLIIRVLHQSMDIIRHF